MQREVATHAEDLPHQYRPATQLHARNGLPPCEVCSLKPDHALHSALAREIAHGETTLIVTEKGS